ncbi:LPS export ABC transporter periplasmic protein LptC [candidate division WOR-3 bacterium]|nr:LPS export ABC transporter periplasmic protein LptC [candidate division WOR-3 bacterium]
MRNTGLLSAGLVVLATSCHDKQAPASTQSLPSQVIEQFTLVESGSGRRLYSLTADRAFVFDPERRVDVVRLRVQFYDDDRGVHSVLEADQGTIYQNENLVARGTVMVRTADSTLLLTDSLTWNNPAQQVRTDAPVEIVTPRGRVRGRGLVSDAGLNRIEIQGQVSGTSDYDFEAGR